MLEPFIKFPATLGPSTSRISETLEDPAPAAVKYPAITFISSCATKGELALLSLPPREGTAIRGTDANAGGPWDLVAANELG